MTDGLDRLKVLINSSTPIVVMETSEEMHAVNLVRAACSELNMATFEWSIADGLLRSGTNAPPEGQKISLQARIDQAAIWTQAGRSPAQTRTSLSPGSAEADRLARAMASSMGADGAAAASGTAIYNTREPVQALANMESMTVEAVFILKDFHRHMDDPVVVRRLRDVGQKFAANRKTVVITAPEIAVPAELTTLVEYFDLPLPDRDRLHEIIHDMFTRLSKTYTLKLQLDAAGVDAMSANLRGLTEEEAERAISQALVTRYALCPETVTDVLEAKKQLLRHSGMLEFVEASDNMASRRRPGEPEALARTAPRSVGRLGARIWPGAAARHDHPRRAGMRQVALRARRGRRVEAAAGEVRHLRRLRQIHRRDRKAHSQSLPGRRGTRSLRALDRRTGKVSSPAAAPIPPRPTLAFRRACWPRFCRGCRTARPPCSSPRPATM